MRTILRNVLVSAILAVAAFPVVAIPRAHAAGITVTPAVIDDQGLPRDILNYKLTVTNGTGAQQNVFASVYNLTASGTQPFVESAAADRPASLANWISVSRAAMIFHPGETRTIPVTIQINPYAAAGDYHAVIAFVTGGTRPDAEQHLDGAPGTIVNLTVHSDAKELLQVASFAPDHRFTSAFPVSFSYTIANAGDVSSTPVGSVMIYDNVGHELDSIDANPGQVSVLPGDQHSFSVTWNGNGGYGQYKAVLNLTYGSSGASLQNVALMWVLPWQKILGVFAVLLIIVVVLAAYLHKSYENRHKMRLNELRRAFRGAPSAPSSPSVPPAPQVLDLRRPSRHPGRSPDDPPRPHGRPERRT